MVVRFEINTYKELISKYPTWEELLKYLESEEGGLFRIIDKNKNNNSGLCLIRYEKGVSKMDLPHSSWFRSIVWNTHTNMPVCVSPQKAASHEFSFSTLKDVNENGIVCQELLDGFMINCFRMTGDNTLHITSRSKLDAAGKFYSDKSFRELFIEAYMNTHGSNVFDEQIQEHSHTLRSPSENEMSTFYSFLVQHKDHRIVKKYDENKVVLIHSGIIYNDGRVEIEDGDVPSILLTSIPVKGTYAQVAQRVNDDTQTEVQKWIKNIFSEKSWDFQGIVFKDCIGNRWRFRSDKYNDVKSLRGNSPTDGERFAQLYTQNLLYKYLEYYPDDAELMVNMATFMDLILKMIYYSYVELHIMKTKTVSEIEKAFLPHLYNIHGIYLTQLKPANKKITFEEIKVYFHKQPWQRIIFLMKKVLAISCTGGTL